MLCSLSHLHRHWQRTTWIPPKNEILITVKRFRNVCGDKQKKCTFRRAGRRKKKLHRRAERRQQLCLDESFPRWSPWIQFVWFSFILKRCFCTTVTSSYFSGQPLSLSLVFSSSSKLHIYSYMTCFNGEANFVYLFSVLVSINMSYYQHMRLHLNINFYNIEEPLSTVTWNRLLLERYFPLFINITLFNFNGITPV